MRSWLVATALVLACGTARATDEGWTPSAWTGASTVELRTDCPDEGEHWFPVWLAVLDGDLYVRLGKKAAARVACTRSAPYLGVRIAGRTFDRVRMVPAPEMADRVAAAMHERYWFDVVVRYVPHPLTLRLVPE